jgi:hypothetical protein
MQEEIKMTTICLPKELAGVFAMWAVRQSPYIVPDNLQQGILEFMAGFDCSKPMLEWKYPLEFSQAVLDSITKSPVCLGWNESWNESKNGRDGIVFSSRYGTAHPDDDFIDLHALQMNICRTIFETQEPVK